MRNYLFLKETMDGRLTAYYVLIAIAIVAVIIIIIMAILVNHFYKLLKDMRKKNEEIINFLQYTSHEIRTPLNSIIGLLGMADKNIESDEYTKISRSLDSAIHLGNIVDNVHDITKLEKNQMSIKKQLTYVSKIVEQVKPILVDIAKQKNVTFDVDMYIDYDIAYVDALKIRQILLNVVNNAIYYTKPGGRVAMSVETIRIKDKLDTLFTIQDNGEGPSVDYLNTTDNPYNISSEEQSTWTIKLGMHIAKKMTEYAGGSIIAISEEGIGSTVKIRFLFDIGNEENLNKKEEFPETFEGKRVLIVDDNVINQEIAKAMMEEFKLTVETAENGQIALDLYLSHPAFYYDIIFMDIIMPVVNGIEATKRIRLADKEDAMKVPIIALTANAFDNDISTCLEAGMNKHLSKPFHKIQIYNILKDELSN